MSDYRGTAEVMHMLADLDERLFLLEMGQAIAANPDMAVVVFVTVVFGLAVVLSAPLMWGL